MPNFRRYVGGQSLSLIGTGVGRLSRVAGGYALAIGLLAAMPDLWSAVAACTLVGLATVLFLTTGNATVQLASGPPLPGAG